ncbi:disease resistance protein RPV1-like isoform X2 [Syzygium oleosum]|uniref:disease resistance protein RPV1-like isoform X2 n=1 Tax=Syzygium oleosum TaxID=219896 RepID=UPI0024B9C3AE|nr:disease resistance protein RPV1-like isoform X2 [Syzygium oleosum]
MKRLSSWLAANFVQNNKEIKRRKADDTSALSSSSTTPKRSNNYDVFLSFRGTDTRKAFVDHLYNSLVDAGISVFKDDDELCEGEKIGTNLLQAIKNKCMKSAGHVVLPIFYQVEPADVQHQKGSFGEAFSHLSGKYSEEDVAEWKQALQEVASLKGWESERTANGREGELVKMVVRTVLSKLKEAFQLVVTKQLVGIDNTVADILRLLDDNPNATQMVGIHGMGDIGKTTLAKVVYNKLFNQFQHRSFIANSRESSQRRGISCLQKQLIWDILETKDEVPNKDEGIRIMESRFKHKKVLILLDDVDNHDQLKALIGKHDWFERGSKIIITTRIRSILDDAEVNCQYELKEIAVDQSLILFSRHAFRRDSPPCEFESLSHDIVSTTRGLPLALEVIGSFLCGKNRAFWQDALKKLEKAPHRKVQETLRISYDALSNEEKQIFLDIACLFIGTHVRITSYMWDACNFYPAMEIEQLSFMSLIKIGDNHELKMHDQLRDLGREIVRQEDYNAPMNRSRLWIHEEALEVRQRNKGIEKLHVRALRLDKYRSDSEFTTEQFETLPNLRFLQVRGAGLIGDSKSLLPELRWLQWQYCPAFVAISFHLEKLVILDLSWSDISELWEGWSHLKVAKELKVLNLTGCYHLKVTPDLSAFQNLEILVLANCQNLEQIHHSIGEVRGLVSLDFSHCWKLRMLPGEMGKLEELKKLNIRETAIEEIPPCIGSLKGLVSLDFSRCGKLRVLPRDMGKLEELKELNICKTAIEEIPPCIGSLKKLEILHAYGCKSLVGLPDSISHLVNLSTLDLSMCISLDRFPESIGSLVKLQRLSLGRGEDTSLKVIPVKYGRYGFPNASWKSKWMTPKELPCMGIRELPESIGDLKNLKILDITASKLSNLPSTIAKLGNLEELHASHSRSLVGEIPIDGFSSLKILVLSWTGVSGFPHTFDKLSRLEKLDLRGCKMLQSLPESISELPSLQHLQLIGCYELQSLPKLPGCLTVLELTCQHRTLPQLSHLIHLKELTVYECKLLESIPELPSAILKLYVYGCDELKELPSLSRSELLSQLDIQNCCELTEIKGLEALKSLVHLSICGSEKLSKFDGLEHAESLRYLDMSFSLVNDDLVRGLDGLKNLEQLFIIYCEYLIRPDLSHLTHLKRLEAYLCHNLVEIKGLERLKKLEFLIIQSCASIETLPDLSCFGNLKYLDIKGCSKLRDVHGLEKVGNVAKRGSQLQGLSKLSTSVEDLFERWG